MSVSISFGGPPCSARCFRFCFRLARHMRQVSAEGDTPRDRSSAAARARKACRDSSSSARSRCQQTSRSRRRRWALARVACRHAHRCCAADSCCRSSLLSSVRQWATARHAELGRSAGGEGSAVGTSPGCAASPAGPPAAGASRVCRCSAPAAAPMTELRGPCAAATRGSSATRDGSSPDSPCIGQREADLARKALLEAACSLRSSSRSSWAFRSWTRPSDATSLSIRPARLVRPSPGRTPPPEPFYLLTEPLNNPTGH
eukprot:scaffold15700_cov81-Isochrysis_galbana.AAC.5